MKKIIAIAAIVASSSASAFWDDNNSQYNTDGRFDGNGYGYSDAAGKGNADGSADGEATFSMTFKGRARGDAKTDMDAKANNNYYGNTAFDGRGYGYNNTNGYPYQAPVAVAPKAEESK